MKRLHKVFILHALFALSYITVCVSGCVSVRLEEKNVPSSKFQYLPPDQPFTAIKNKDLSHAWQDTTTGNSISVFSSCNEAADLSLHQIQTDTLSVFEKYEILEEKPVRIGPHNALSTIAVGKLDNAEIKTKLISTYQNGCSYSLSYVAPLPSYPNGLAVFEKFIQGFELP